MKVLSYTFHFESCEWKLENTKYLKFYMYKLYIYIKQNILGGYHLNTKNKYLLIKTEQNM